MAERPRDRSFAPTVLTGLGGATLAAVAGAQTWATSRGDAAGVAVEASVTGSSSAPLVVALALVALAAWGVVLVLRGRARRAVAVLGAAASAGVVLATALSFGRAQDDAVLAVVARGATGDAFSTSLGGWYYATLVGAFLTLAAFGVAVVRSPGWPAMGSRYDAPAARTARDATGPDERPRTDQDLWRDLDQGHDPTT